MRRIQRICLSPALMQRSQADEPDPSPAHQCRPEVYLLDFRPKLRGPPGADPAFAESCRHAWSTALRPPPSANRLPTSSRTSAAAIRLADLLPREVADHLGVDLHSRSARCSADAVEGSEGLSNSRTAVITKRKTRWSRICRAQLRLLWNYGTPFIAGPQKRPPGRNWPLTPMAVPLLQAPPIAADTNSRRSAHEDRSPLRGCGLISGSAADQLCWPKLFAARSRGYMVTPWGC
jgi:hypothetical protein